MDPLARLGLPAPDFTLPDLEGRPHRLSDQRGRVVVLNFWSAECPWSARADEVLRPLEQAWGAQVVHWRIASNVNESVEEIRQAAEARGVAPVLLDRDHRVADLYGAAATPHLYVIDGEGVLRYMGALDDATFRQRQPTRHYLAEAVAAVLDGRAPETAETLAYGCAIVRETPEAEA